MNLPELRPRQPFTGLALAAVAGVVLADRWILSAPWLWAVPLLAIALVAFRPRTWSCWILVAAAFFTLHSIQFHGSTAREIARALESGRKVVRATGIVWSEPEPPSFASRNLSGFFRLKLESLDLQGAPDARGVIMNVNWSGRLPIYGDRITLTGSAENSGQMRNPGQFDFTRYLQRLGIYSELTLRYPEDGRIIGHGLGSRAQAFAFSARHWIQNRLNLDLEDSPELTDLIQSMVLGLRGETAADVKELFQRTGTLHLFAVSGLNVAMLAAIVLLVLKPLRIQGVTAVAVVIPVLCFYALVTGLGASCVRATIMGSLLLLAPVFDRRPVPYNSLSAAAFLILAWDTNQLFSAGFQFSFVLVFTIVFLARRLERRFAALNRPDPFLPRTLWTRADRIDWTCSRAVAVSLGVTVSAWIGSLIFTAGYFHLFSPAAIVANLIAVPIAFLVLGLGVATLLVVPFWKGGAILFNNANWFMAKALLWVVQVFALVPGGHIYVELPGSAPAAAAEITVLDVGDGGAAHVRVDGNDWMIDCGSTHTYDRIVLPYLRTRGVNYLDGLILTHGDSHHVGGALSALDDFQPQVVADSILRDLSPVRSRVQSTLAQRKQGKSLLQRGDWLHFADGAPVRVLYPPPGLQRTVADDKTLVLQFECAGTRVLFMSDAGFATEQWLLENEPDLRSDIVIKGQHSKDFSGTIDFLLRVQPEVVVCSALSLFAKSDGLDEWEREVTARGIRVFRQDQSGAVLLHLRSGGQFDVQAYIGKSTFRNRAR